MRYFDFHAHIILKQVFSDAPNIDAQIGGKDVGGIVRLCTDLPNIIQTQIHQSQLAEFREEVVIGVVLHGLESYLAKEVIGLRGFLKKEAQHKLSLQLLQDVVSNKCRAFSDFSVARTLELYLAAPLSFHVLTAKSFTAPLPVNKVNVFFSVEGCHSLVDSSNEVTPPGTPYQPTEILRNLDILLKKVKIVSVNLTHLQQSNLCNHAFGMQLTHPEPFYPAGNGLTDDGRKVTQGLFDRGVCVDVKHMSYKSRLDLRNEIDAGKFTSVQPPLCSHAGFTGMPFSDWPGYISLLRKLPAHYYIEIAKTMQVRSGPQRPGAPAFNSSTMNLFDEEIVWIVKNGGMIGLSLDRRILGYVSKFDDAPTGRNIDSLLMVDKEYLSKAEVASLGLNLNRIGYKIQDDDCFTIDEVEDNTEQSIPARDEYFYDHILLHLKHYLQVTITAGISLATAIKHITFGSDFDGLINPFINLSTVKDLPALKKYIKANFRFYLETLTDSRQWVKNLNVDEFTEALFYTNGFTYIKARLTGQ